MISCFLERMRMLVSSSSGLLLSNFLTAPLALVTKYETCTIGNPLHLA